MFSGIDLGRQFVVGLPLVHRGKVRDTYSLPLHPELLLVVASDRVSIFDFVLNVEVERKGEVLTAMNIFWRNFLLSDRPHDLVAYGREIDNFLPYELRGNVELQKRAVVVRNLEMVPVECIVRVHLTGSGLSAYRQTGEVCGHKLPEGLTDGSRLPQPIFTPTTKAEVGHDEHITDQSVEKEYGSYLRSNSITFFTRAAEYARGRGVFLADTKFEFGYDPNGVLHLGDEVLTPDSSRFWDVEEWAQAQTEGKSPPPHDKQFVRNWGKELGIHKKDPTNPDDYAWVREQVVDREILAETSRIYSAIFQRLTGNSLEDFQKEVMGIGL